MSHGSSAYRFFFKLDVAILVIERKGWHEIFQLIPTKYWTNKSLYKKDYKHHKWVRLGFKIIIIQEDNKVGLIISGLLKLLRVYIWSFFDIGKTERGGSINILPKLN